MTTSYSALIHDAMEFAAEKHDGQYRKNPDTIPYISHPAAVGIMLARAGADDEVVAAGILHDVLEDCGVTDAELAERFGKRVARLVAQVTEQKSIIDWNERKRRYREGLAKAETVALLIACADHLHNVNSLMRSRRLAGKSEPAFKGIPINERLDNERGCRDIFDAKLDHPLAQEFDRALEEFERLLNAK